MYKLLFTRRAIILCLCVEMCRWISSNRCKTQKPSSLGLLGLPAWAGRKTSPKQWGSNKYRFSILQLFDR